MSDLIQELHDLLPPQVHEILSLFLLEHVEQADYYFGALVALLTGLVILQSRAFSRPPPVPLKRLPKRPMIQFYFKPDDVTTTIMEKAAAQQEDASDSKSTSTWTRVRKSLSSSIFNAAKEDKGPVSGKEPPDKGTGFHNDSDADSYLDDHSGLDLDDDDETKEDESVDPTIPTSFSTDLPDSFAPLLSSSQVEVKTDELPADLIHAVQVKAEVRLRQGRHEIPLDMDKSRPQFILDVPAGGCRLSAVGAVGSDGFSSTQDLDASVPTSARSKPMFKHAGLVLDPPLPLSNVAPTLIHFPTLFEDNFVPTLRRIQIVRYFIDFIISISSFIERCLWIVETKCKIHLSKVRITPVYKGLKPSGAPDWRLSLAFSGHVLLFGILPIPFISVVLPTFIIPQPHALLENLLTKQPLASAKLRREYIDEEKIALAAVEAAEQWNLDVKLVATPPAVAFDITLPGGVTMALKMGVGRDSHSENMDPLDDMPLPEPPTPPLPAPNAPLGLSTASVDGSLSSFSTQQEPLGPRNRRRPANSRREHKSSKSGLASLTPYDANTATPWFCQFKAKGAVKHDKMTFRLLKLTARQQRASSTAPICKFDSTGTFSIWKVDPEKARNLTDLSPNPVRRKGSRAHLVSRATLDPEESPSVAAVLLFPEETTSFRMEQRMLTYDYAFDVADDSCIDAITLSVGATHPMLKGATSITAVLESLYCYGSMGAREDAILDPMERKRKRNILRHLPAVDFTCGLQNVFIPQDSHSYSDDGLTLFLPELDGGRLMARLLGGIHPDGHPETPSDAVHDGVKLIVDFEIPSLNLATEGNVKEFPELDIFEGAKLRTILSGIIGGTVRAHLRPQALDSSVQPTGRNIFNPLEAYEIEFSGSNLTVKMKEFNATLGHRRVIFPAETAFVVSIIESVVDMGFEGRTQCDLSWDFNGLSPILQVTPHDLTPEEAGPESKQQVSLLISPLRFGLLSFHVSSVGGIQIKKAATSREDKEGLFDWKFFNALVSPDETSPQRILDVVHDKRTMEKLLQVVELVNKDLHKLLKYGLKQVWRAKEIFDDEGISEPANVIPMYKMSRLITLLLTGDIVEIDKILPIVGNAVHAEGLDVARIKELLREHLDFYDDWAPEFDRALRWAELMLAPIAVSPNYVEENVVPLAETPQHSEKLRGIPSATELYDRIVDKPQLPLEPSFSNLVSRVAPYLSYRQIEFLLETRAASDWQQADLRRLRYVFSIKRKVLDIAESYGGLSFLPQSFLVSVFLGEATRNSYRAPRKKQSNRMRSRLPVRSRAPKSPSLPGRGVRGMRFRSTLNRQGESRGTNVLDNQSEVTDFPHSAGSIPQRVVVDTGSNTNEAGEYQLGDSLLGPQDVAILLQSGLASVMKSSTVVQLNQRMLLDLIGSQPRSFAIAVLAEIGMPGGQGDTRSLTSALMSLLELDQTAFKPEHQIDMHALMESWLPGMRIPRREDYMAGGRWARQSYYDSLFSVAKSILDDAETYQALKGHIQRSRNIVESDPIPVPKEETVGVEGHDDSRATERLMETIDHAKRMIAEADALGNSVLDRLIKGESTTEELPEFSNLIEAYEGAFRACSNVVEMDKHAFHASWFSSFFKRNYDALMIRSMYDNVVNDVDQVRHWLHALRNGAMAKETQVENVFQSAASNGSDWEPLDEVPAQTDLFFMEADKHTEQDILDAIIDATIYDEVDRDRLRNDPLVRLLIPNPPGEYNFTIVSAMGVITDGERGVELKDAFKRLEEQRGVQVIRADTGTARSLEYNASKIEDAIIEASKLERPFGLLGYSQGCANILMTETIMLSGTPNQRAVITSPKAGLVCRQLLFSASNGSVHGPATSAKIHKLIVMCEEFFKYQQGYVSRALASTVLEALNSALDSSHFHKLVGGVQVFLTDGCRAFWRESQHMAHVTTCTLKGIMEEHTTPESLLMLSKMLTKQSGSHRHDSQVHAFDAVGYPIYHHNRNGKILERCAVGEGAIQRTHHWSPLSDEVEFVETAKDVKMGSFQCAKDRHVFPWVEVNARFGFIKPKPAATPESAKELHPTAMLARKEKDAVEGRF